MNTEKKPLSFVEVASALDSDFENLNGISLQLEHLEINTDSGLKRGKLLLGKFGECGERIGSNIQLLASALTEAQARSTEDAKRVSERALAIQKRQEEENAYYQRFENLRIALGKLNQDLSHLQVQKGSEDAEQKVAAFAQSIPDFLSKLTDLIGEVQQIEDGARDSNMKGLHKEANSLRQSMQSMLKKLDTLKSA